ncbi:MAG: hypothetical protein HDR54_07315 [Treponema sp.]|nr:hypothetical protein [Treponema sp.]
MVLAVVLLILGAVMPVWFGIESGNGFLGFLSYVVVLVIAGFINENVLTVVVIVFAGISVIFLIYQLVDYKKWKKREKDELAAQSIRDIGLLNAVTNHEKETVQKLIAEGADVNYKDIFNKTPLYVAVENGDKGIVSILAEKADVNFVYDGKTIVQYAKDDEIITILRNHGAKTKLELDEASKEAAAEWNSQRMLSEDLLTAIQKHEIGIAETLISQGADVNYVTLQGNTPLTFAIYANDMEMIKLLLKNGADAWKEVRMLTGGSINAINFARYMAKNEDLARFLEYS